MLIDFREIGEGRERNIKWLPLVYALTRDWTHNLSVYWTMFQLTEPHQSRPELWNILVYFSPIPWLFNSEFWLELQRYSCIIFFQVIVSPYHLDIANPAFPPLIRHTIFGTFSLVFTYIRFGSNSRLFCFIDFCLFCARNLLSYLYDEFNIQWSYFAPYSFLRIQYFLCHSSNVLFQTYGSQPCLHIRMGCLSPLQTN